jgi:acetolactate synthase-1/2/3 large subunit
MVAAGKGNDEIMAVRGIRPLFDEDDVTAEAQVTEEA